MKKLRTHRKVGEKVILAIMTIFAAAASIIFLLPTVLTLSLIHI